MTRITDKQHYDMALAVANVGVDLPTLADAEKDMEQEILRIAELDDYSVSYKPFRADADQKWEVYVEIEGHENDYTVVGGTKFDALLEFWRLLKKRKEEA